jgi:hypothetical protein
MVHVLERFGCWWFVRNPLLGSKSITLMRRWSGSQIDASCSKRRREPGCMRNSLKNIGGISVTDARAFSRGAQSSLIGLTRKIAGDTKLRTIRAVLKTTSGEKAPGDFRQPTM